MWNAERLVRAGLATLLLCLATEAQAATIYVNPGGNDTATGSSAAPYKTIKKAATVARAGDRVMIADGTYSDSFAISGVQGSSTIQFIAQNPLKVFITGSVTVYNSNHVVLSGLQFTGGAVPRYLIWSGSYNGSITNCRFSGGQQGLLFKDGSVTIDGCQVTNFASDGIQVDGAAELVMTNTQITGCGGDGVDISKTARVAIDHSNLVDNNGVGIQATNQPGSIPVTVTSNCSCTGSSPRSLKQQAHDLLSTVNPSFWAYQQMLTDARSAILASLNSTYWKDDWNIHQISYGETIYAQSKSALEKMNAVYSDDVDFAIANSSVTVKQDFKLNVKVLGAQIAYGTYYKVPVTTRINVGSTTLQPWGAYSSPTAGNVNDTNNPREYSSNTVYPANTTVVISGQSWVKHSTSYSGSQDSHFYSYLKVDSSSNSSNLKVLRDGDNAPNFGSFNGQQTAASFVQPYLDENGKIKLNKNQAIFLFELGTTNLNSAAADFQDLVVLLTMTPANTAVTQAQADTLRQAMNLLLESDKVLAECAINQATCARGDVSLLDSATTYYDNGLADQNASQHVKASLNFAEAWKRARQSVNDADVSGGVQSNPVPPSNWAAINTPSLTITASVLTGNSSGVVVGTAGSLVARSSNFSSNDNWGLNLRGSLTLDTLTVNSNGVGGIWLDGVSTAQLAAFSLQVQDNAQYGVYANGCSLSLDANQLGSLGLSGGQCLLGAENSNLTLSGGTLQGGSQAAVRITGGTTSATQLTVRDAGSGLDVRSGNVTLNSCTFRNNAVGLYAYQNAGLNANASSFRNNTVWGAAVYGGGSAGTATFTNCTIENNGAGMSGGNAQGGGLYLGQGQADTLRLSNTTVRDNGTYGLYVAQTAFTFNANTVSPWLVSGHDYQVYGAASALTFSDFTVSGGRQYAVAVANGSLSAVNSTFRDSQSGLFSDQNSAFSATGCSFTNNTSYGLRVRGPGSLVGCQISSNGSGLLLEETAAGQFSASDTAISANTLVGLYASNSAASFDSNTFAGSSVTGSRTLFYSDNGNLSFTGLTIAGGTDNGIAAVGGQLNVTDVSFSNNGVGLNAENLASCQVTGSTFTGNTSYGARVQGRATFQQCSINQNQNGLLILNSSTGDVTLQASQLRDNTDYGVFATGCTLAFNANDQANWVVEGNDCNFGGSGTNWTFTNFVIRSGRTYGLCLESCVAQLDGSTATSNGTGVYADAASSLTANNSTFSGNSEYGAAVLGAATFDNCAFTQNLRGLRFEGLANGDLNVAGASITGNSEYGLHLVACNLAIDQGWNSAMTIANNGYGIVAQDCVLAFDQYASSGNGYGAYLSACDVSMQGCSFTGSSIGLYVASCPAFTATSSTFANNSLAGALLVGAGTLQSCSLTENPYGLLYINSTVADAQLADTSVQNNTTAGVYLYNSSLTLADQANQNWRIANNATNLYSHQSTLALSGAELGSSTSFGLYSHSSNVTVHGSRLNASTGHGLYGSQNSQFVVENSRIDGTTAGGWAILNYGGPLTVRNSIASGLPSGIYSNAPGYTTTIYNATVANVTAYGIYFENGDGVVRNTILAGSNGSYGLGKGTSNQLTHSHNLVDGFASPFLNLAADDTELLKSPRFVDLGNGDLHLAKGSPAINAGSDLSSSLSADLEGTARPAFKVFDIGAYEYADKAGSFRVVDWQERK